jgi:chaperonin GroES
MVRPNVGEEVTAGGIFIPEAAKEKNPEAEVVGVGRLVEGIEIGMTVLITPYAGMECKVNGEKLLVVDVDDVMAIISADSEATSDEQ